MCSEIGSEKRKNVSSLVDVRVCNYKCPCLTVFQAHVTEAKFRDTHCPLLGSVLVHICYLKYFYQATTCDVMIRGNGMKRLKGEKESKKWEKGQTCG